MAQPDRGFKIINFQQLREMKLSERTPKPKLVFINRRRAFKPPADTIAKYLDMERRRQSDRNIRPLDISRFDSRYRHKLVNDKEALSQMRRLAVQSKEQLIYIVRDKPTPEPEIFVSICTQMIGGGVW